MTEQEFILLKSLGRFEEICETLWLDEKDF